MNVRMLIWDPLATLQSYLTFAENLLIQHIFSLKPTPA